MVLMTKRKVRLSGGAEWRRYADDQGISFSRAGKIDGGLEPPGSSGLDHGIRNMQEVAPSRVDCCRFLLVDVEPDYSKSCFRKTQRKGKPYVSKTDNTDRRGPRAKPINQ